MLYSYMKQENAASAAVARANGMRRVDEFLDAENEWTAVYAVTKDEWKALGG